MLLEEDEQWHKSHSRPESDQYGKSGVEEPGPEIDAEYIVEGGENNSFVCL